MLGVEIFDWDLADPGTSPDPSWSGEANRDPPVQKMGITELTVR